MYKLFLKRGQAFTVGAGENGVSEVHVAGLTKLYVSLAEATIQGGGRADWGANAYYFAEGSEYQAKDLSTELVKRAAAKSLLKHGKTLNEVTGAEADEMFT